MNAAIFFISCLILGILILVFIKPKVQRMNRKGKRIFKQAMRTIDKTK